jgi:hypothetical protein
MSNILNEDDSSVLMNAINHYESLQHQAKLDYALTKSQLVFIETFNLKPYIDGNQWCILLGENVQEGIFGCGDSPVSAIINFNNQMYKSLKQQEQKNKGGEQ